MAFQKWLLNIISSRAARTASWETRVSVGFAGNWFHGTITMATLNISTLQKEIFKKIELIFKTANSSLREIWRFMKIEKFKKFVYVRQTVSEFFLR